MTTMELILETCSRMNISYDAWVKHHEAQPANAPDEFWCAWVDEWHNVKQESETA